MGSVRAELDVAGCGLRGARRRCGGELAQVARRRGERECAHCIIVREFLLRGVQRCVFVQHKHAGDSLSFVRGACIRVFPGLQVPGAKLDAADPIAIKAATLA